MKSAEEIQLDSIRSKIPFGFRDRVDWGLYGGRDQFYIKGVDGTLAQLGPELSDEASLRKVISHADTEHKRLVKRHEKTK